MNRDVLRELKPRRGSAAANRPSARRIAMTCLVALFATGVWWLILHFGGRAVGYPLSNAVLLPVLAGIFALLVLGLNMAAMATSGTPHAPWNTRQDGVADPMRPRRKHG